MNNKFIHTLLHTVFKLSHKFLILFFVINFGVYIQTFHIQTELFTMRKKNLRFYGKMKTIHYII